MSHIDCPTTIDEAQAAIPIFKAERAFSQALLATTAAVALVALPLLPSDIPISIPARLAIASAAIGFIKLETYLIIQNNCCDTIPLAEFRKKVSMACARYLPKNPDPMDKVMQETVNNERLAAHRNNLKLTDLAAHHIQTVPQHAKAPQNPWKTVLASLKIP